MKKLLCFSIISILCLSGCGAPTNNKQKPKTPEEYLSEMTLEEKVAQMFIVHCPELGTSEEVEKYSFGGMLFFASHFKNETPESITEKISHWQEKAKTPMFIAVDEEGGIVTRVSRYTAFRTKPFPSPQKLYAGGGMEKVAADTDEKSKLLLSLGVNLNFAPVCDVATSPDAFIYPRTLGQDAVTTAEYVKTVVSGMNANNIGSALKHFPGYGDNEDTHIGYAIDTRPYESFAKSDFLPFKAGIDEGAGMVMVSHNIVKCMDKNMPASLSPAVHEELRSLGFEGIIITDDLTMDAIKEFTADSTAAVMAIKAGNDMLCCSNYEEQIQAVVDAVKNGEIPQSRIDESVRRILKYKEELGIIKHEN